MSWSLLDCAVALLALTYGVSAPSVLVWSYAECRRLGLERDGAVAR